jgi:PAS domain S-box-containing protein
MFAVIALTILAGGLWYYHNESVRIRLEKNRDLDTIAELKAQQIVQWKKERLADVWRAANGPTVIKNIVELARNPDAPGLREELLSILQVNLKEGVYANVFLVDPDGKTLLAAKDDPEPAHPDVKQTVAAALASRQAVLSDLFIHSDGLVHIDAAAATRDAQGRPLAVMILRSNAKTQLYPLIQSWPTPSRSAETLLLERQGDKVILLNELRHQTNNARFPSSPLTQGDSPAVQAALGKAGAFRGKDYRDVDVLANLRPIPGLPWVLVVKEDAQEILAEVGYRARTTAFVVVLFILLAGAISTFAFRQQQAVFFRLLYQTERQNREAEETLRTTLKESEARLKFALQSTHIGAWDLDLLNHTALRTPLHDRIFGHETTLPLWTYEMFLEHVLPDDRPEADRIFRKAIAEQTGLNFECRIRHTDGAVRWIWVAGDHLPKSDGKSTRMAGIVQDITDRKCHDEQLRKIDEELVRSNRELEQFAYVSSHDLQEPLRMVTSFVGLLRDRYQGRLDAAADQYIGFAIEGAERMQALIAGLLDYSRVGKKEDIHRLQAEEPLQAALANLKSAIEAAGATVDVGPLPEVAADSVQLTQVFQNLIGNAVKFRGEAAPQIRISAARQENTWDFSVQDNGIGIDPKYGNQIFEVFRRLHTHDQYSGTGIGLAICKKIVESHGGRIWVESQPGAGSTFHFTIPA